MQEGMILSDQEGENSWQSLSVNDGDKFVLEETNLFALTSELSWLGDKAEEAKCFLQNETNSAQVITTSASILSHCDQSLSFAGEEEVVEMAAADILTEQSHSCSICGKEFRREGNVRIHMRSHGEQYKSKETLTTSRPKSRRSYFSCPLQGCRYNKRHPNFKHLKSVVSLRNHYRRSHCWKMYSCNNCGKEFSFLGDLKTHGNKCGHSEWHCSCSLTFSTRNKLLHHVALGRQGHKPVTSVPAVTASNGGNSTGDDKTPEHSSQEVNDFAVQDSSVLTDSSLCYAGSDQDVYMMGLGWNGIEGSEYGYERMESEVSLSSEDSEGSELYASLFWQKGDLLWP